MHTDGGAVRPARFRGRARQLVVILLVAVGNKFPTAANSGTLLIKPDLMQPTHLRQAASAIDRSADTENWPASRCWCRGWRCDD